LRVTFKEAAMAPIEEVGDTGGGGSIDAARLWLGLLGTTKALSRLESSRGRRNVKTAKGVAISGMRVLAGPCEVVGV